MCHYFSFEINLKDRSRKEIGSIVHLNMIRYFKTQNNILIVL